MNEHETQIGPRGGISDELRPYVDRAEADEIDRVAQRLSERPIPAAPFRARLRAQLAERAIEPAGWRPRRLGLLVTAYAGSGLALLAVAAIGLAGTGPLGY
ncbi:MAG: hypothetical protein M3O77_07840 [Chloroflexota bacterium]|nr:hypothetical protein [Chloroflexota bacterium]